MKTPQLFWVALLALLGAGDTAKLPSTWKTCVVGQANTDVCLKKNIQTAIDELARRGAPSLGVYPIDPMRITMLRLQSGSGSVSLDLTFLNLDIFGFKNLRIDQVDGDLANDRLAFKVTIVSDLLLNGDYVVKGRLLVVPIGGSGRCNITLGNPVTANAEIALRRQKGPDGRSFPHVEKFHFDFSPKTFKLFFHDKDHGNTQLGTTLNRIANDNANEILRDLKPAISEAFGQAFEEVANRIFSKVPYDELFPSK